MKFSLGYLLLALVAAGARGEDCGSRIHQWASQPSGRDLFGLKAYSLDLDFDEDGEGLSLAPEVGVNPKIRFRAASPPSISLGPKTQIDCREAPVKCLKFAQRIQGILDQARTRMARLSPFQEEALQCAYLKTAKFQEAAKRAHGYSISQKSEGPFPLPYGGKRAF